MNAANVLRGPFFVRSILLLGESRNEGVRGG